MWLEHAKTAVADSETLEKLRQGGYSQDIKGYGEMMRRIKGGGVELHTGSNAVGDESIRLVDMDTLKARPRASAAVTETVSAPKPRYSNYTMPPPTETPPSTLSMRSSAESIVATPHPRIEYPLSQSWAFRNELAEIRSIKIDVFQNETARLEAMVRAQPDAVITSDTLTGAYRPGQLDRYIRLADEIRKLKLSPNQYKNLTIGDIYKTTR